jgi:hypothetical protein
MIITLIAKRISRFCSSKPVNSAKYGIRYNTVCIPTFHLGVLEYTTVHNENAKVNVSCQYEGKLQEIIPPLEGTEMHYTHSVVTNEEKQTVVHRKGCSVLNIKLDFRKMPPFLLVD